MVLAAIAGGAWLEWMLAAEVRLECFGLGEMPVEQIAENWRNTRSIR